MKILNNTLKLIGLDGEFIVKPKSSKAVELTVYDILYTILIDEGATTISILFKGHNLPTIRDILNNMFFEYPKTSSATPWYTHILSISGYKKCPACGDIKPLNSFAKNSAMKSSGVDSWCLTCTKEYRDVYSSDIKLMKKEHQINNKSKYAEASAKRRAIKLKACPNWSNSDEIKLIYNKCPVGMHVDHWAPLQGVNVCGLHVPNNLQYLPSSINISKGNKFEDTDEYFGH